MNHSSMTGKRQRQHRVLASTDRRRRGDGPESYSALAGAQRCRVVLRLATSVTSTSPAKGTAAAVPTVPGGGGGGGGGARDMGVAWLSLAQELGEWDADTSFFPLHSPGRVQDGRNFPAPWAASHDEFFLVSSWPAPADASCWPFARAPGHLCFVRVFSHVALPRRVRSTVQSTKYSYSCFAAGPFVTAVLLCTVSTDNVESRAWPSPAKQDRNARPLPSFLASLPG